MQPSEVEKGRGRCGMVDFVTIRLEGGTHSSRKVSEQPTCDVVYAASDKREDDASLGGSSKSRCR